MFSKEILKTNLKLLNGFIPVYKPAGMCSHRLSEGLKLDMYFVFQHCDLNYGQIQVNHARDLEPFADGLMTFALGYGRYKTKNFVLADYVYKADIEFGVQRQFNTVEGQILSSSSTSHITIQKIENQLSAFTGYVDQSRCQSYQNNPMIDADIGGPHSEPKSYIDLYNQMVIHTRRTRTKPPQKYPIQTPPRTYLVKSITLDNYHEPMASFTISSEGSFSARTFAADLANRLGTVANVVKLSRVQEGPIHVDDLRVLQPYELHLEHYIHRLSSLKQLYKHFNDAIDPLWEHRST